jgi:CAAX protease family protein
MDPAHLSEAQKARRGLAIYFTVLILGSGLLEWKILQRGESIDKLPLLILALMYVPAAASIVARLGLREGISDVSFGFGARDGLRALLLAWIYPIVVGTLAYGAAWITGLAKFQPPLPPASHLYSSSPGINLVTSLVLSATLGTLVNCLSAFGEELGWRGYMLTRLITGGVPRPVLASGVIWAFWHVPFILSGQYTAGEHPALSAIVFVIGVTGSAYLISFLRLKSGSIWPAVMLHGADNAIIQGTFDRATAAPSLAVGESGLLTMGVTLAVVFLITRGVWPLQRRPSEPLALPSGRVASVGTL